MYEVLILSFCSKRTRYLIHSLQKYRWKAIKFVHYSFDENDKICVSVRSENSSVGFSLSPTTLEKTMITPMDVFGMGPTIPIRLHPNLSKRKYLFNREQKQLVVQGIHDYLHQFLGSSTINYVVDTTGHELPQNLKNIKRTCIKVSENTTAEELEACFAASPNQEYIQIDGHFNGNLCPNSAILGAEHLRIISNKGHGDEILLGFRGKRFDCDCSFHDATIVQFLNEWKSNRGFHNLESLIINSYMSKNYDAAAILKDIDVKQLDRPQDTLHITWQTRYAYPIAVDPPKLRKVGFSSRDYLLRDGDGVEASVLIQNHDVCFALWKGNSCEVKNING
ncbi:hypothetical protein GCK72_016613 [Caenorhabditis remanei]|uniref:F-box associated domain-containing protein n=1 Tax=Caenorhabditis remanei TaxID=31234 RepID=A0A6A5G541_CAERE|nr:hypothetical protein GCK72_016613 [Caenorhabditis remanei]KAF1750067.1 hypothetical protein GCK72_016613 [Caenorhabditis remanei]